MKLVKVFGISAIVIICIVIVFTLLQPTTGHVEKSVVINAPDSIVFKKLDSFSDFIKWSPWAKMDPDAKYTYEGPSTGVGAKMTWQGKSIGHGSQWIIESEKNKRIKNGINFEDLNGIFYAQYILEQDAEGTRITWTYDGENHGFMGKMRWLFMKGPVATQCEDGLHDLKYLIEGPTIPTRNQQP